MVFYRLSFINNLRNKPESTTGGGKKVVAG
jgi:hypothetical protein